MLHCSREFLIGNHNLQKFLMSFIQTTERSLTLSRVRLKYTSMTLKAKSCFDADFFSSCRFSLLIILKIILMESLRKILLLQRTSQAILHQCFNRQDLLCISVNEQKTCLLMPVMENLGYFCCQMTCRRNEQRATLLLN